MGNGGERTAGVRVAVEGTRAVVIAVVIALGIAGIIILNSRGAKAGVE